MGRPKGSKNRPKGEVVEERVKKKRISKKEVASQALKSINERIEKAKEIDKVVWPTQEDIKKHREKDFATQHQQELPLPQIREIWQVDPLFAGSVSFNITSLNDIIIHCPMNKYLNHTVQETFPQILRRGYRILFVRKEE